jgi:hypothetical protein
MEVYVKVVGVFVRFLAPLQLEGAATWLADRGYDD